MKYLSGRLVALTPFTFGAGKNFKYCCAIGLIWLVGMILPGRGWRTMALPFNEALYGSYSWVPSVCRICEKSPRFSASVGTLMKLVNGCVFLSCCQAKNQNSLSLPFQIFGR